MTLTITIPSETEARLKAKAEQAAQPVEEYLLHLIEHDLQPQKMNPQKRRVTGYGKFAHIDVSSEDVHRARREELALEEEREKRRQEYSEYAQKAK